MARLLYVVLLLNLPVSLQAKKPFECVLAARPNISNPDDPASQLITNKELVPAILSALYGGLPVASLGIFVLGKLLSQTGAQSEWDKIKAKVELLIDKKLDESKMTEVCHDLKEFRRRVEQCAADEDVARTSCLKHLFDYMVGKEVHFTSESGRELALLIGPYTLYSVMTLAVGNMLIKQNKQFPLKGAATLSSVKAIAEEFSAYINASVPRAIAWRQTEIGHYKQFDVGIFRDDVTHEGIVGVNRKRSVDEDGVYIRHQVAGEKRRTGLPPSQVRARLVVTDAVLGNEIFNQEGRDKTLEKAFNALHAEARPIVERLRREARDSMLAIYNKEIFPITNQYWRVYHGDSFGDIEEEVKNRDWLLNITTGSRH